jgi:hypothetical protein
MEMRLTKWMAVVVLSVLVFATTGASANGYEFDGSTQFKYVNFLETLRALRR